jgi:hypothetical protein
MVELTVLAQGAPQGVTLSVIEIVGALVGGTSIVAGLVVVAAKGYWSSTVAPLIEKEIRKWYQAPEQNEERHKEQVAAFREWYDRREQMEEREKDVQYLLRTPAVVEEQAKSIRLIIDNEIKRSDGLISREIHSQVSAMESRLLSKLEEMSQALREANAIKQETKRDDDAFKQEVLRKIGKLEGAINMIVPGSLPTTIVPERPKSR